MKDPRGWSPEPIQIDTSRLSLRACSADLAEALMTDRRAAEVLVGAGFPPGWPDAELRDFLPVYAQLVGGDPAMLGFGIWLLIERDTRIVAGSAGFQGRPDADGEIEIGYGIDPAYRDQGLATEAVQALVRWGFAQAGVIRIVAHCDPANGASIRVLAKSDFRPDGQRNGQARWVIGPDTSVGEAG